MKRLALIIGSVAALSLTGLAAPLTATAAPASHAVHTAPAAPCGHGIKNSYGQARFNTTSGLWWLASAVITHIDTLTESGGYYLLEDCNSFNYMDYVSGTGVTETTDSSLARAHWVAVGCIGGGYEWKNVYFGEYLYGDTVGANLDITSTGGCNPDETWLTTS